MIDHAAEEAAAIRRLAAARRARLRSAQRVAVQEQPATRRLAPEQVDIVAAALAQLRKGGR